MRSHKRLLLGSLLAYLFSLSLIFLAPLTNNGPHCEQVAWWQWVGCMLEHFGDGQFGR